MTDDRSIELIEAFPDFKVRCLLNEVLEERGMTKKELSQLTGIRPAMISEMSNTTRIRLSLVHLMMIAKVLRISDLSELYVFEMSEDTKKVFESDRKEIEGRGLLESQEIFLSELNKK